MKRDDDPELWDLLGQTAEPKISPFFARNATREIRQSGTRVDWRDWLRPRRLIPAVSVVTAIVAFAIMQSPKSPLKVASFPVEEPAMIAAPEDNFFAEMDDLVAADEISSDFESAFL
ncbi:MAG: hypothetical protein ABJB09_06240 [Verrucomicrobiota bacterium]